MLINDGFIPTKTTQTKAAYSKRAVSIISRFGKLHNLGEDDLINPDDFINWLIEQRAKLKSASWRQYKAALVYYLEEAEQEELAQAILELENKPTEKKASKLRRTSSNKKKSVSEFDESRITDSLLEQIKNGSFWAKPTLAFFKAILATGLRPFELSTCKLVLAPKDIDAPEFPHYPVLVVKNAKHTNNRAHGEFRHLYLHDLLEESINYLRLAIQYANPSTNEGWTTPSGNKANDWEHYYQNIRQCLYRTVRLSTNTTTRKGPFVTIYSARHQFIANLKLAGYKLEEIAALVGHATDDTATFHYGRKTSGRSGSGLPQPDTEEVAKIRQVYGIASKPKPAPTPSTRNISS